MGWRSYSFYVLSRCFPPRTVRNSCRRPDRPSPPTHPVAHAFLAHATPAPQVGPAALLRGELPVLREALSGHARLSVPPPPPLHRLAARVMGARLLWVVGAAGGGAGSRCAGVSWLLKPRRRIDVARRRFSTRSPRELCSRSARASSCKGSPRMTLQISSAKRGAATGRGEAGCGCDGRGARRPPVGSPGRGGNFCSCT